MPLPGNDRFIFSGRHYRAIARALHKSIPSIIGSPEYNAWCNLMNALGDTFETDNERFDRMRFIHMCIEGVDKRSW